MSEKSKGGSAERRGRLKRFGSTTARRIIGAVGFLGALAGLLAYIGIDYSSPVTKTADPAHSVAATASVNPSATIALPTFPPASMSPSPSGPASVPATGGGNGGGMPSNGQTGGSRTTTAPVVTEQCTPNDSIRQSAATGGTFTLTIGVNCAVPSGQTQILVAQQDNGSKAATYCLITKDVIPSSKGSTTFPSNLNSSPTGSVRYYYVIQVTSDGERLIENSGSSNGCYLNLEGAHVVSSTLTHTK